MRLFARSIRIFSFMIILLVLLPLPLRGAESAEAQKLPGTASVSQESLIYGQTPAPLAVSETNTGDPSFFYKLQGAEDASYSPEPPVSAGVYTVKAVFPETDTHLKASASADFTIRALITAVTPGPLPQVPARPYNGALTPVPAFHLPLTFQVEGYGQPPREGIDYLLEATLLSPKADLDPQSRNLSVRLQFPEGLYSPSPDLPLEFLVHADILKAPLTIKALDQAVAEGFSDAPDQISAEGLAPGDRLHSVTLSADGSSLLPSSPCILRDQEDVTDQYDITLVSGTLTHNAAVIDFPAAQEHLIYNGSPQPLLRTPGIASGGAMVYEVRYHASQSSEEQLLSDWSEALPQGKAPGLYTVNFKARGETLLDSEIRTLVVVLSPRPLEVSASGRKIYDGLTTLPEENVAITMDESQIVPGEEVRIRTISGSSFQSVQAGQDLKVTPGNAVLEGRDAENYSVKILDFTGTIEKRPITVKARPARKAYGQQDPVLSYTVQGAVPGEQLSGKPERTPGQNVGTYSITQGSLTDENNQNYRITFLPSELIISPARLDLRMEISRKRIRPGKTLFLSVTGENPEKDRMKEGWNLPETLNLFLDGQALPPMVKAENGSWSAEYTVPRTRKGSLRFTVLSEDPNYQPARASVWAEVRVFSSIPRTGDLILVYGTLMAAAGLLLAGIAIQYWKKKKK